MSKRLDLIDQQFEELLVSEFSYTQGGYSYWLCLCACGNYKIVKGINLINGNVKSCGHLRYNVQDLTNLIFNYMTVVCFSHIGKSGAYWLCHCKCGKEKTIAGCDLKSGHTKSCGCYNLEQHMGQNHHRYSNGSSLEKYPLEFNNKLRVSIRNRDYHKCQFPGCIYDDTRENLKLSVHHIDGDKNNCQEWNLVSLCINHHMKIESTNPGLWQHYFYNITSDYINEEKK